MSVHPRPRPVSVRFAGAFSGVVAVAALWLAASADAAPKSNLRVSSLGKPPAVVEAGKKFALKITVANDGGGTARSSSVGFYLGYDAELAFGKAGSLGKLATPKLAKGKSKRGKAKLKVPSDAPVGQSLWVVACADDTSRVSESDEADNCRAASPSVKVTAPLDAIGRIQLEYDQGKINLDQGALYLAYASTGDKRLPKRFGKMAESFDSDALRRVAANFPALTPKTQRKLDPFFSPPIYGGGPGKSPAYARRNSPPLCFGGSGAPTPSPGWTSVDTTHFRIWHPVGDDADAIQVAAVAENVYDEETLLWREPLSDAGEDCNGGDGRTDVYIKRLGLEKAQVVPFPPGDSFRPAWMWINPGGLSGTEFRDVFAHEFAHVVQLAYHYAVSRTGGYHALEYGWLEEATASWAIDYVYPDDNYEHRWADDYYKEFAWRDPLGQGGSYYDHVGYRDYLFFFYLSNELGDGILANVLGATESNGSIAAVDAALGSGFADRWQQFALHNLNQGDYNEYSTWDPGLTGKLPVDNGSEYPHLDVKLNGNHTVKTPLPGATENQAYVVHPKEYQWVSFSFDDADVRKITLRDFGYTSSPDPPPPEAKVTAWYELANGEFHTKDWTGESKKTFCRDKAEEDVVRLVLFYTNGKPTPYLTSDGSGAAEHPKPGGEIEANDKTTTSGCPLPTRYEGTWTRTYTYPAQDSFTETINGRATFVRDPGFPPEVDGLTSVHYYMESSSVTWTVSGSQSGACGYVYSGSGNDSPDANTSGSGVTRLTLEDVSGRVDPEPEPYYYSIRAVRDALQEPQYDIYSPCDDTHQATSIILPYLNIGWPSPFDSETPQDELEKSADATLLAGHTVGPNDSGYTVEDTWSFTGSN
jgi:CARDB